MNKIHAKIAQVIFIMVVALIPLYGAFADISDRSLSNSLIGRWECAPNETGLYLINWVRAYEFNEDGTVLFETGHAGFELTSASKYSYDANGELIIYISKTSSIGMTFNALIENGVLILQQAGRKSIYYLNQDSSPRTDSAIEDYPTESPIPTPTPHYTVGGGKTFPAYTTPVITETQEPLNVKSTDGRHVFDHADLQPSVDIDANSSYAYITATSVNFRQTPGGIKTSMIHQYGIVQVYGSQVVGNTTWYNANYDGTIGWIHSDYLHIMTSSELSSFLNSDQYYKGIANNAMNTGAAQPTITNTPELASVYAVGGENPLPAYMPPSGSGNYTAFRAETAARLSILAYKDWASVWSENPEIDHGERIMSDYFGLSSQWRFGEKAPFWKGSWNVNTPTDFATTTGFIGMRAENSAGTGYPTGKNGSKTVLYIVFKGTNVHDREDWEVNIGGLQYDNKGYHMGFATNVIGFELLAKEPFYDAGTGMPFIIDDYLENIASDHQKFPFDVVVTGHSLGGAMASIYTQKLIDEYGMPPSRITAYTFGSPKTNRNVSKDYPIYNFVNKWDTVPMVGGAERAGTDIELSFNHNNAWDAHKIDNYEKAITK